MYPINENQRGVDWGLVVLDLNRAWREEIRCAKFENNFGRQLGFQVAVDAIFKSLESLTHPEWITHMKEQVYSLK